MKVAIPFVIASEGEAISSLSVIIGLDPIIQTFLPLSSGFSAYAENDMLGS